MNSNWYALAVQPRKESYVAQQLRHDGFPIACPRYLKVVRHARKTRRIFAPLFPGYLFVQLEMNAKRWRQVNWVSGSIGLVKFGDHPIPLEPHFAESFILPLQNNDVIEFNHRLKKGDRVTAVGGPFDRCMGEVIAMSEDKRVKILMDALNRKVETTLPTASVIATA